MRYRLIISVAVLSALAFVLIQCPKWAIDHIESKYSVQIGDWSVSTRELVLHNVNFDKGWAAGSLAQVAVGLDSSVEIRGGTVKVDLTQRPDEGGFEGGPSQKLGRIQLDTLTVHHGIAGALVQEVTVSQGQICFRTGQVDLRLESLPTSRLALRDGCASKTEGSLSWVELEVDVPKGIVPEVWGLHSIDLHRVEYDVRDRVIKAEETWVKNPLSDEDQPLVYLEHSSISDGGDGALLVGASKVQVNHPWVARTAVVWDHLNVVLPVEALLDRRADDLTLVTLGDATLRVRTDLRWVEGTESCGDWIRSLPSPHSAALNEAEALFSGNFSFEVSTEPTPKISIKNDCKFDCRAPLIQDLKKRFEYQVYGTKGMYTRTSGPGSSGWAPLGTLPPHVGDAFISLEDPSFRRNKGILVQSLNVAMEQNLDKGYFFRGGSTITQQLAKNLWLNRDRTIGRKVEEAFLTLALESCLTKDEILELYLNVVEYGPDLYGIGPASRHYFGKDPDYLTLDQSYYLASLMPAPRKAVAPDAGGMRRAHRIMEILSTQGRLPEEFELPPEASLEGWVLSR